MNRAAVERKGKQKAEYISFKTSGDIDPRTHGHRQRRNVSCPPFSNCGSGISETLIVNH